MTNEEAKKMLKAKLECFKNETSGINHDCNMRLCDGCSLNYEQGNMGEQKEALDMAIKALERVHTMSEEEFEAYLKDEDLVVVKREILKKALEQQPCEDAISRTEALRHRRLIHDDDGIGYSVVRVDEIIALPSVTPKTEWIPCSEKMPDINIHVLAQFVMGGMAECYYAHNWWHIVGGFRISGDEVIAWMPLPEPYKAESEDEE